MEQVSNNKHLLFRHFQESGIWNAFVGWFWLWVSPEVAIKLLVAAAVISRLSVAEGPAFQLSHVCVCGPQFLTGRGPVPRAVSVSSGQSSWFPPECVVREGRMLECAMPLTPTPGAFHVS